MRKAISITLFIVLYLSITSIFGQKTDLEKADLNGKVKSVRETVYSIPKSPKGNPVLEIIIDNIHHYNELGNKTKSYYHKGDTLFSYSICNYNDRNELSTINEYNSDGSNYLIINFASDDKGIIVSANYNRKSQKAYDDERKSIDIEYDKYYQQLFTRVIFKNDFKGYVIEATYLTANNKLAYRYTYKYDYKYHLVETKFYNNSGKVSWRKTMKYNSDGNLKASKYFESNRIAQTSTYDLESDQYSNWINCKESRVLHDNFFADGLNDNTIITVRKIEYY